MQRRLTVILAADLAGWSRLVAADEEGTITRLRAARASVIDPAIAEGGGRIVKTMGDGLLVEFGSAVAAVQAALAVQRQMATREAAEAEDRRLRFRIGVHLGDVVIDGADVLGDAVNVAARLETLAPAGGICVSRAVFEASRGRVDAEATALGPQPVKNLPEPVEAWRIEVAGAAAPRPPARPAERPSIAVLPFDNMSSDPDQEFLADGIVEDVITELSRFRSLMVIARNSTFAYKGAAKDVRRIGEELGARYVVEGSVRRGGARLRVTAQLIEAATGAHVWADRWDRTLDDLFALQDELTQAIVTAVEPELGAHERRLARARPTESLTAWELCQRGWSRLSDFSTSACDEAEALLRRSVESDDQFALPCALLARVCNLRVATAAAADPEATIAEGIAWARRGIALDDRLETGHAALAVLLAMSGRAAEAATRHVETALALNPNSAFCQHAAGLTQLFLDPLDWRTLEARGLAALALSPRDPSAHAFQQLVTVARLFGARDYGDPAFQESARAAEAHPGAPWYVHLLAAAAHAAADDPDAARRSIAEALRQRPDMTDRLWRTSFRFPHVDILFDVADRSGMNARLIALGLPRG